MINHIYIRKRLCYILNGVHCAYCDKVQRDKFIKNKFGQTIGFTVKENEWTHYPNCQQKDITDDSEEEI